MGYTGEYQFSKENELVPESRLKGLRPVETKTGEITEGNLKTEIGPQTVQNIYNYNITVYQTGSEITTYGKPYKSAIGFIQESIKIKELIEYLSQMEENLDEPVGFEQARAAFLSGLRSLEGRKHEREVYFTDLLTLIDVGVSYTDCSEMTKESTRELKEAVKGFSRVLTNQDIKDFRKLLRDAGIDILRPLNVDANISRLIKEIFS